MHNRSLVFILAASLSFSSLFTACSQGVKDQSEESEEEVRLAVTVTSPVRGSVQVMGEFSGALEYADETSVFPKLSGEVTATYFEEGDYVNAGDLMFTLDDEASQMTLRTAEAVRDTAQAGYNQQVGAIQMNRDSAANSLANAWDGIGQAENTYGYYQEQYGDLEEKKSDLEEDKDDLEDDKKSAKKKLKKAKKALSNAKGERDLAEARLDEALSSGASSSEINELRSELAAAEAEVAECQANVTTYKTKVSTMESGIDSYDDAIDQVESSEDTLNYQMRNLGFTYGQAQRGTALAQENLDYYNNIQAPNILATADASLRQAQVGVDSAKLQLDYTQVKAPVSGVVKKKDVEEFDMITSGSTAYVITNDNAIVAAFSVPESVYRMLWVGEEILAERKGETYTGRITEMPMNVDGSTGLFKIKATLDGAMNDMATGTAIKITCMTNHVDNVITIPVDCVYYTSGEAYTYAVQDGIVRKVPVVTGLYDDERMEILEGLTEDMQIVDVWSSDLRDGLPVDVAKSPEEEAAEAQDGSAAAKSPAGEATGTQDSSATAKSPSENAAGSGTGDDEKTETGAEKGDSAR